MRVNDPNLNPAQMNSGGTSAAGKTAQLDPLRISTGTPAADKAGGAKSDSVQISSLSSKINELQSGSAEREASLERLSASVADGSYNPDPAEVSTKLVNEMLAPKADEKAG
jgi:anti-sigma28 factor (negative regulator of flagellin synthesis)